MATPTPLDGIGVETRMASVNAPSSRAQRSAKAQSILDAAAEIIERDGLESIAIRTLATAASVSPATIYNVFGSRDGVLDALADDVLDILGQSAALAPGDTFERAVTSIGSIIDTLSSRPALYRPLVADRRAGALHWHGPRRQAALDVALLNLRIGAAAGEVRDDLDLAVVAHMTVVVFENNQGRWAAGDFDVAQFRSAVRDELAVVLYSAATDAWRPVAESRLPRPAAQ